MRVAVLSAITVDWHWNYPPGLKAKTDFQSLTGPMTDERIRLREEVAEQLKALESILGQIYGFDLTASSCIWLAKLFSGFIWLIWLL